MPYTFECGTCNSVYRLDERQITSEGVKVTCPKCLSFFILRAGSRTMERPVVEHVVSDGMHEIQIQAPRSETTEIFSQPPLVTAPPVAPVLPEPELPTAIPIDPPVDEVRPTTSGETIESSNRTVTIKDLLEYLPDPPPPNKIVSRYIMPTALTLLAIAFLFILHFRGFLSVPVLDLFFKVPPNATSNVIPDPTPATQGTPKYGFPQVDAGYDPWSATPQPQPQAQTQPQP